MQETSHAAAEISGPADVRRSGGEFDPQDASSRGHCHESVAVAPVRDLLELLHRIAALPLSLEYPKVPVLAFIVTSLSVAAVVAAILRAPRRHPFGPPGWVGLSAFCLCGALVVAPGAGPVFLGAIAWTGLILAVDSSVHALRGRSLIRSTPAAFAWLAMLSIFLWLPFEWYNLRLGGWYRSGLPPGPIRYLLLGWFSACIWPALFEMADLFAALAAPAATRQSRPMSVRPGRAATVVTVGAACLAVPVLVPRLDLGEHMLPLVGVGFLLLLDPLNAVAGRPSVWSDWRSGNRVRVVATALSGGFCGLLADCLNHGAGAKWHSIYRAGPDVGVLELPLVGYLVLPLFALQALALHAFAAGVLGLPRAEVPTFSVADLSDDSG